MKRRLFEGWLLWLALPEVVRIGLLIVFLITCGLLFGCSRT